MEMVVAAVEVGSITVGFAQNRLYRLIATFVPTVQVEVVLDIDPDMRVEVDLAVARRNGKLYAVMPPHVATPRRTESIAEMALR